MPFGDCWRRVGNVVTSQSGSDSGSGFLRFALALAAVCVAAGLGVGALWALLAPRVMYVVRDGNVWYREVTEAAVAADLILGLLLIAAGVVTGVMVVKRSAAITVGVMAAVAVAGVLGSLTAWAIGLLVANGSLSSAPVEVGGRSEGTEFAASLSLDSPGVLGLWSVIGVLVLVVVVWRRGTAQARYMNDLAARGQELSASSVDEHAA